MTDRKIPQRQCLGCQEMKPKKDMIRIVKDGENVFIDLTGRKNGRGAYVCDDPECIRLLIKKKGLDRSFRCHISGGIYESLSEAYGKLHE